MDIFYITWFYLMFFYNSILIILIWLYFVCVDKVIYTSFNYWRIKHILLKWLIQTSHVQLFATPWTVACQVSLSLTISWSLPIFKSIALAIPASHIILWYPLLLSIFSSIRDFLTFLISWLFTSDDQNPGTPSSASVFPMSIQGWFPIRLTDLFTYLLLLRLLFISIPCLFFAPSVCHYA